MRKVLVVWLLPLLVACQKTEVDPSTALNNTFWTGFFSYPTIKDAPSRGVAEVPYGFELVEGGEYKHFEFVNLPFQMSRGRWQLKGDTLVITQANNNVITFKYFNNKLSFLKMSGPPLQWNAFDIEKYEASSWQNLAGAKYGSIVFPSETRVSYLFMSNVALERYNNVLWWDQGRMSAIIRNNGVMYHLLINSVLADGITYTTLYKNTKN